MIRLHDDSSLTAVPIFLPRDEAIPVGETPAPAQLHPQLRRRAPAAAARAEGRRPLLVAVAYSTVAGIALSLLALLAWALHRLAVGMRPRTAPPASASAQPPRPPARRRQVNLPLAHHSAIVALPVFAPALVVILVLLVHRLREGRHWDKEETDA